MGLNGVEDEGEGVWVEHLGRLEELMGAQHGGLLLAREYLCALGRSALARLRDKPMAERLE